jgi:hypothetical protein
MIQKTCFIAKTAKKRAKVASSQHLTKPFPLFFRKLVQFFQKKTDN